MPCAEQLNVFWLLNHLLAFLWPDMKHVNHVKQAEHLLCVLVVFLVYITSVFTLKVPEFWVAPFWDGCQQWTGVVYDICVHLRWMSTRGCVWHLCAGQVQDNYHLGHLQISKLKQASKVKNGHSLAWCSGFESWLHIRDTWELWNTTLGFACARC